jgi:hypothetical protein
LHNTTNKQTKRKSNLMFLQQQQQLPRFGKEMKKAYDMMMMMFAC